jgi:hypothetical protein
MEENKDYPFKKAEFVSMKNPEPETLGQILFIEGHYAKLEFILKGKRQTRIEPLRDLKPLPKKQIKEEIL